MKRAKAASGQWSLTATVAAGLFLRLVLFHLPTFQLVAPTLERRPEFSTPVSSFMAVKEAVHLRTLFRSSSASLPKPYATSSLHLPPILLACFGPLFTAAGSEKRIYLWTSLILSFVDVLSGIILADIFERKKRYIRETHEIVPYNSSAKMEVDLNMAALLSTKGGAAATYLLNPYTVGSCLARSTSTFNNFFVLAAIDASMAASPLFLAVALSASVFTSLYPALLVPCLVLLCAKSAVPSITKSRGRKQTFSASVATLSAILMTASLGGGIYFSYVAAENDWRFVSRAYGAILLLPDLSPTIGLWWYFFIEIFDHFRDFFLLAFNVHAASYSIPLTIKYRQDPLFAATVLCGFIAVLKSYPTMSDTALFLSLLSLYPEIFPYLRHPLVTWLLFLYATVLMPALHYLWLNAGSGNANFFYATTLVWALAGGAAVLDAMWAWGRWRWELERPAIKASHGGKQTRKVIQM